MRSNQCKPAQPVGQTDWSDPGPNSPSSRAGARPGRRPRARRQAPASSGRPAAAAGAKRSARSSSSIDPWRFDFYPCSRSPPSVQPRPRIGPLRSPSALVLRRCPSCSPPEARRAPRCAPRRAAQLGAGCSAWALLVPLCRRIVVAAAVAARPRRRLMVT